MIMGFGFFDTIIIFGVIGAIVWLRMHKHRAAGTDSASGAVNRELEREVARLRERITVLERIATDERDERSLAREIERLRE